MVGRFGLSRSSVGVEFNTQKKMDQIKEELWKAVHNDNVDRVKEILDNINDVKAILSEQRGVDGTLLHLAVRKENLEMVLYLVEKSSANGCGINAFNSDGQTPLYCAMSSSNNDVAKAVIDAASIDDINVKNTFGITALHIAIYKNKPDKVNALLEKGADIFSVNTYLQKINEKEKIKEGTAEKTKVEEEQERILSVNEHLEEQEERDHPIDIEFHKKHITPLYSACLCADDQCMNYLLEHMNKLNTDADKEKIKNWINLSNGDQTVLHLAMKDSKPDIIKKCIALGSDVNKLNNRGESALHTAAAKGNKQVIRFLLEKNGDMIKSVYKNKKTLLHVAAQYGKSDAILDLIERGFEVDAIDEDENTPLILAASKTSNRETLQRLLKNKEDISKVNKDGFTVLHYAVNENNEAAVDELLKSHTCNKDIIDFKTDKESPAVHLACRKGYEKIALMLLEKDANVNIMDKEWGQTLLHIATYKGQEKVAERILMKNAWCIDDVDRFNDTPLHNAAYNGHRKVISLLIKFGASIHVKNANGNTPILIASECGNIQVFKELHEQGASIEDKHATSGYDCLHYSCENGHREVTEYILSICSDQDIIGIGQIKGWNEGCNALELAIQNSHEDIAKLIIDHDDWEKFLTNKSSGTTPVREMIEYMPDVAHHTFSRCISKHDHDDGKVRFNYEFIDDMEDEKKINERTEDKHPLSHMIKHNRNELLLHPLVIACIEKKWRDYAAFIYYLKLFLYTLFLSFLTGYILVNAPICYSTTSINANANNSKSIEISKPLVRKVFVDFGKYMVLLLAVMHLIIEIIQMISQRKAYLSWVNLLEWIIFLLAIVNVLADFIPFSFLEDITKCGIYRNSTGAACIFFAWLNFMLFLRKIGVFGIYVVMFFHISKTFFKFFTVFMILIAAFGFSFCVLLQNQTELPAFHNPLVALVKTIVMMTGELGFDDIFFQDPYHKDFVLWILFGLFVFIMNIVLMNLLVGLAVDDINSVQKEAEMAKAVMKINLCLEFEKLIPKQRREKYERDEKFELDATNSTTMSLSKETIETVRNILRLQDKEKDAGDDDKAIQHNEKKTEHKDPNDKLREEIEECLDAVQVGMEGRLDAVQVGMEGRLDAVQVGMEGRLDAVKVGVEERLDAVKVEVEKRLDVMEQQLNSGMEKILLEIMKSNTQ